MCVRFISLRQSSVLLLLLLCAVGVKGQTLRESVGKYCLIGAALSRHQSDGFDSLATSVVRRHFNTAVAENCMKPESLQPVEGEFSFEAADRFVEYCRANGLTPTGHCLMWHSQIPRWFFVDGEGKEVSREVLISRIENHVRTVVSHFRGRILGWDVVNEAIEDDGSWRKSPFYRIVGEEFIDVAFRAAHEADPDVELYYNDYSLSNPHKRDAVCRLVRHLKSRGLRIDAVGMQSHHGLSYPSLADYEASMEAFAALGVKVMVTELDVNVLPNPRHFDGAEISQNFEYMREMNPYPDGLPAEKAQELHDRYMDLFRLYHRHRDSIARITLWGVSDANSWLNDWPMRGRTNYPLLFDRQYREKPVVGDIVELYAK